MKILLIRNDEPGLSAETNITGIYPPLGLAYIASVLRKSGYKAAFLDNRISGFKDSRLKDEIKKISPDVVLLSAMTSSWPGSVKLSRLIKEISPRIVTGIGGPHMTAYPIEALSHKSFDFGIYGEGENTILEALNNINEGRTLEGVKGCYFRRDGGIAVNSPREEINDLDTIPFPAIDLLPYRKYIALSVENPFFTMVTSRGCPYSCKFCFQGYLGRYRARSAENVVREMDVLVKEYGIREIITFDETFGIEEKRVLEICGLIQEKGLRFKWDIRTRIDLINEKILRSLKSAGCRRIHLGIESGNQSTLRSMDKKINVLEITDKIKLAKEFGFELRGYFMLAYPGDTAGDMHKTIEFAKSLPLDWASFTVTIGLPGTEIYKEALVSKRFSIDYWREYTKGNAAGVKPYFIPDGMKEKDLFDAKRKAYLEFYLRPKIALNIFRNLGLIRTIGNLQIFLRLMPSICNSITGI
jgi:anaerobic magnesium-protoporphyrin IX monomethyl ester cyclase